MSPITTTRVELSDKEVVRELPLYTNLVSVSIITLLILFALGSITCLALFTLNAFGITNLSDTVLGYLAAATIAKVIGLLAIIYKKVI